MSLLLQRLAPDGMQRQIAQAWGVSESTISRLKEQADSVLRLAAHCGLKVVPAEARCFDEAEVGALLELAKGRLRDLDSVSHLTWED